ncbi:hypothetical protein MKW94_007523 [Papaver nudicaule]|uniref:Uncharacterized protein n=1 Tax=Papaver nudicaule TaxID=74823 RepID=A0AA41UXW5_PAPNU|nr:hypothetical protein [Papaver nudicaule]
MIGNGVVGILSETINMWERRAPLTPSHCERLLNGSTGVTRIIIQPSMKRIHHDALYEDVGCDVSQNLSDCGLILGVKQPKLEMILPNKAYAFFSHTHKAQRENMPLLDKILLLVGDHGKRLLGFGKFAGRAGVIDMLHGLGIRYLSKGYSTPFLSIGASYTYPSLAAAKAAVSFVGTEITTHGLPSEICPIVFVFTGDGNVSQGAQEIFNLLSPVFVVPSSLHELSQMKIQGGHFAQYTSTSKRVHKVFGCVATSPDMVEHQTRTFDRADYYAHPEEYNPIFHKKIAPYASVIVNCMYWEERFPRLLSIEQLQELTKNGYDPLSNSYHDDMKDEGVICLAVDNLPAEFAKEATEHFGDILLQYVGTLASTKDVSELPSELRRACIANEGSLTSSYEYIPRMRNNFSILSDSSEVQQRET